MAGTGEIVHTGNQRMTSRVWCQCALCTGMHSEPSLCIPTKLIETLGDTVHVNAVVHVIPVPMAFLTMA